MLYENNYTNRSIVTQQILPAVKKSWLRHLAISRKDAGSIPDGVIGNFHWLYPSARTMALGSTQPLTEISNRNISWEGRGLKTAGAQANKLTTYMCRMSWNLEASISMNPQGLYRDCFNPLNPELNPICYLLALLGAHHFLHVSKIRVKFLTFRRLMSYIYGTLILDVSRSHTTTQHSR